LRKNVSNITQIRELSSKSVFGEGELYPHLTQHHLGQGLPPYHVASWSIQPFGHNRYGLKIGVTVCTLGPKEAQPPIFRQTGQDNGPIV